jgi:hypothetical protein
VTEPSLDSSVIVATSPCEVRSRRLVMAPHPTRGLTQCQAPFGGW